jgi:hypothetical protein
MASKFFVSFLLNALAVEGRVHVEKIGAIVLQIAEE